MTVKHLARTYSAELEGVNARLIEVETDINVGLHSFTIVGLADKALNEARERVNSAIKNCGAKPPNRENRRITVNLAPADFKKTGSHYDLAIAMGYLLATKQIDMLDGGDKVFVGELALDGRLRPVNGALSIAEAARNLGFKYLYLPRENAEEASVFDGINVVPLGNLREAIALAGERNFFIKVPPVKEGTAITPPPAPVVLHAQTSVQTFAVPDLTEIIGQENAKRALLIAAAGGHNMLMTGPPGIGKSMLAHAMTTILPVLSKDEAIEITKIWSAAGLSPGRLMEYRPFRSPHQTSSVTALVGGGQEPRPGEISLAHRGVLFLDELPEFSRAVLEALREPLESGSIHIARAKHSIVFPAKFSLVAAMNPCPCGYYGSDERECKCAAYEVIKYQKKISGPFLDRIDIQIKMGKVAIGELRAGEGRDQGQERGRSLPQKEVELARAAQRDRFARAGQGTSLNTEMSSRETRAFIRLDSRASRFMAALDMDRRLSPRGYYRTLKVARTIADIEGASDVSADHLAEAFSYRLRDP